MYRKHGAFYFVADNKWHPLGREYGAALVKYAAFVGSPPKLTTVHDAIWGYIEFNRGKLAKSTIENYQYSAAMLDPVLGHVALQDVKQAMVYKYVSTGGDVQHNRNKALLSAAFTYARNTGDFEGVDPTKGLQFRNPEKPRQRYVTDQEATELLEGASDKMACIAKFLALIAVRQSDALRVKISDIDDEGIHVTQGKTGKRQVFTWTEELRAIVNDAMRLWRRFGRIWLFESHPRGRHAKKGIGPYTPSGLRSNWRRSRAGSGITDVRLHDLRRKASSDMPTDEDAQHLLGHADGKVTKKHYRAKPDRVKPVR